MNDDAQESDSEWMRDEPGLLRIVVRRSACNGCRTTFDDRIMN